MRHRGWLLDPYIRGDYAVLWLKTVEGEALQIKDRYRPHFYAEPKTEFKAEDIATLLEENLCVFEAKRT